MRVPGCPSSSRPFAVIKAHTHDTHTSTPRHEHTQTRTLCFACTQVLGNPEAHLRPFCKAVCHLMGPRLKAGDNIILCISCQGGRIRSAAASVLLAALLRKHNPGLNVEVFLPHLCSGQEEVELHNALDFASGMRISHSQLRQTIDEDSICLCCVHVAFVAACQVILRVSAKTDDQRVDDIFIEVCLHEACFKRALLNRWPREGGRGTGERGGEPGGEGRGERRETTITCAGWCEYVGRLVGLFGWQVGWFVCVLVGCVFVCRRASKAHAHIYICN